MKKARKTEAGLAYVALLFLLIILVTLGLAFVAQSGVGLGTGTQAGLNTRAEYLAQAAVRHAIWLMENDCSFTPDPGQYYLHDMDGGRYGYRLDYNSATGIALVGTLGLVGDYQIEHSYVVPVPNLINGYLLPIYGDTTTTPKYRRFNYTRCEGAMDVEGGIADIGNTEVNWAVIESHPQLPRALAAFLDGNGTIRAYSWNGSSWGNARVFSSNSKKELRSFDIAYEQSSNRALIAGWNGTNGAIHYNILASGNFWQYGSQQQAFSEGGASEFNFVTLAPKPASNEMLMLSLSKEGHIFAHRWSGSRFSKLATLDTSASIEYAMPAAVAYSRSGASAVLVWAEESATSPRYRTWNGSLSAEQSLPNIGAVPHSLVIAASSRTEEIALIMIDEDRDIQLCLWNGSAWGNVREVESDAEQTDSNGNFNFDVCYESESGDGLAVWTRASSNTLSYLAWANGSPLSSGTIQPGPNFLARPQGVRLCALPGTDQILVGVNTSADTLRYALWNGQAFDNATPEILKNGTSTTLGLCFDIAAVGK